MKKVLFPLFFTATLCSTFLYAQSDTIPFTLNQQSNICIRARVNDSDSLLLMFHSSTTGLTLTQEAVDKKLSLAPGNSTRVQTWGGTADARYVEGNTLTINRLHWDSLTVFVDENSGLGTDGKFGYDLFAGKILTIDYDHRWLIVASKLPKIPKRSTGMSLFFRQGSTYILGELKIGEAVYRDTFMYHTGYGGAVLLDPAIGERYGAATRLETISTSTLEDAYGNVFKIETKRLPQLRVGGQKIKNVPLSFAAYSSDIPMKVFGNGLLKRFNTVLDFQKNEIYLSPNSLWNMPF